MGILGGLLLLAAAWAGSLQLASAASLPSLCILLLWTLPYMGSRGQAQSREDRELSRIKGEFLTGSAGAAFFLLLAHSPWGGTGLVAGLEALAKVADGKATKIIIPSEIQNVAGLVKSVTEVAKDVTE